jgi:hypothetical protein
VSEPLSNNQILNRLETWVLRSALASRHKDSRQQERARWRRFRVEGEEINFLL